MVKSGYKNLCIPALILAVFIAIAGAMPCFAGDTVALIRSQNDPNHDYTIEGEVVTIWEDSFLLDDQTGQIVVDVKPRTIQELNLAGRDYVLVSGRYDKGVFKPVALSQGPGKVTSFLKSYDEMMPPLSDELVRKNTLQHRFISATVQSDIDAKKQGNQTK